MTGHKVSPNLFITVSLSTVLILSDLYSSVIVKADGYSCVYDGYNQKVRKKIFSYVFFTEIS